MMPKLGPFYDQKLKKLFKIELLEYALRYEMFNYFSLESKYESNFNN
jgi:hypothetical protein